MNTVATYTAARYTMALVGLRRFIDRQLNSRKARSPLGYAVLATIGVLIAAILKYPNRAIFTRARPDLKGKTFAGFPLLGDLPRLIMNSSNLLNFMELGFNRLGNSYAVTLPVFGRLIMVNTPECYEHVFKNNFDNYIKGKITKDHLKDILGDGIFVSDADAWRFH
ncbi:cytochrome P450-dit2, partial [Entomortierella beljakovae]